MNCKICGQPPTQALVCTTCNKAVAHLCDGFLCQPKIWRLRPDKPRSCVPLLNFECETCQNTLHLRRTHAPATPVLSTDLHMVWLRGKLREDTLLNLKAWCGQIGQTPDSPVPLLWMDTAAINASSDSLLIKQTQLPSFHTHEMILNDNIIIRIMNLETWLERSDVARCLQLALLFEAETGVVQVASDILRILVLRRHGGVYVDAGDVGPNRTKMLEISKAFALCQPNQPQFLCRWKPFRRIFWKPENDLILLDHRDIEACVVMAEIERKMTAYYNTNHNRRALELQKFMGSELEEVKSKIASFVEQLKVNPSLCTRYIEILEIAKDEPSVINSFYNETIHPSAEKYFLALEGGINDATMTPYSESVKKYITPEQGKKSWSVLATYFSDNVSTKDYYSWKTPGLSIIETRLNRTTPMNRGIPPVLGAKPFNVANHIIRNSSTPSGQGGIRPTNTKKTTIRRAQQNISARQNFQEIDIPKMPTDETEKHSGDVQNND